MSSDSSNQEQSSKNLKQDKDDTSKKSKDTAGESQAGTSKSFEADRKKLKKRDENENKGFFPQGMWFWKQEEPPQQEVQIKNWSTTSISNTNVTTQPELPQQSVKKTESQYIWPDTLNIREPQRLVNQPTLDQIIEQRKLRENQLIFAQDFNKHVDYLGDRMSKTKLNILIAQLNKILPSSSEENLDSTKKLIRAKPLQVTSSQQLQREASNVSEHLTLEEITQRKQLREDQLQEIENLRNQIDSVEDRSLQKNNVNIMDETISKTDLNKLIDLLNEMPSAAKENNVTPLQELIQSKPRILEIIKQAFKKASERLASKTQQEQLRNSQIQEFEHLCDQIALYEDRSVPKNFATANTNMKRISNSILEETLSKSKFKKNIKQLDESESIKKPESSGLFRWRTRERLTPEEVARRDKLRQNQLQEYENLREQIGLFGERRSDLILQDKKEIFLGKNYIRKGI